MVTHILIKSFDENNFIEKLNKVNKDYNIFATQYKPLNTPKGVLYTALCFIKNG